MQNSTLFRLIMYTPSLAQTDLAVLDKRVWRNRRSRCSCRKTCFIKSAHHEPKPYSLSHTQTTLAVAYRCVRRTCHDCRLCLDVLFLYSTHGAPAEEEWNSFAPVVRKAGSLQRVRCGLVRRHEEEVGDGGVVRGVQEGAEQAQGDARDDAHHHLPATRELPQALAQALRARLKANDGGKQRNGRNSQHTLYVPFGESLETNRFAR